MVLRIAYDSKTIWPGELDKRQLFSFATATTQQHGTVELQWQKINRKMFFFKPLSKWSGRTNKAMNSTINNHFLVWTLGRVVAAVLSRAQLWWPAASFSSPVSISGDTQCALGERCISATERDPVKVCIKICFYDAHCLGRRDSGDIIMTKRKNLEGVVVFSAHVF